jgi:FkbM family methyltransferase
MHIQIGDIDFEVSDGPNDSFWKRVNDGNWETDTYDAFRRHVDQNTTVVDIGAWIGPTTLYLAQLAKRVLSFEPDPVAFAELERNLEMNPAITNVTAVNAAVSNQKGRVKLGIRSAAGDSSSSILLTNNEGWDVETRALRDVLREAGDNVFVKMDIEGHEFALATNLAASLEGGRGRAIVALHPHFFGVARAARIGRRDPLRKLAGSVAKRTIGRLEGYRAVQAMARSFARLGTQDLDGTPIDLSARASHVLRGDNVTESGSVILVAAP